MIKLKKIIMTMLVMATLVISTTTITFAADGGEYNSNSATTFFGKYEPKEEPTEDPSPVTNASQTPGKVIPHTGNTNQTLTMSVGMAMLVTLVLVLKKNNKQQGEI